MPRYVYRCDSCLEHFQIRHGMSEKLNECIICLSKECLVRVPQMPSIAKEATNIDTKTGSKTEEFIEKNRDILNEMKKEARSEVYDG